MSARVAVLGVHAGDLPPGSGALLAAAAVVAGGRRLLDELAPPAARRIVLGADLPAALDAIAEAAGPVCVLASGDPGFFGVLRALSERLGAARLDVRPAASSVAVAFGRIGLPWEDAVVVSAHGRAPEPALHAALRHPKVAVLTEPRTPPAWFAERLAGSGRELAVAERLGEPDERVVRGTPEELAAHVAAEPSLLLVLDPQRLNGNGRAQVAGAPGAAGWALPESAFEHRAGMITKREVRALALARLGPRTGDLVWDVGCGSGSVAIEAARLGAAAIAVDRDPDAVALTQRNAAAHGVPLGALVGSAPQILAELPDPDAVFVGGGGTDLDAILDACAARVRRTIVVTLALIERAGPALERLGAAGLEADGTLVQASRLRPLQGGHRLAAENPVVVLCASRS